MIFRACCVPPVRNVQISAEDEKDFISERFSSLFLTVIHSSPQLRRVISACRGDHCRVR